jgi:uncharacterized protein (TIGR03435 family)
MRKNLLALGAFGPSSRLRGRIEALLARGRVFFPTASPSRAAASATVLLTFAIGASFAPRWIAIAQTPTFEVASIRLHVGTFMGVGIQPSGPNVAMQAMSLQNLVGYAYNVQPYQILGGPSWVTTDRFDISAKAEGDSPLAREQIKQMTQALLADRFGLKYHHDTKEMPVYALVVGKNRPKFKESKPDAERLLVMGSVDGHPRITVTHGDMAQLAGQFSNVNGVDRPTIDKTGLTGTYDYQLDWSRGDAGSDVPVVFTAIQEQLGLKFQPDKARLEVLVIDRAEKPGEN